MSVRFHRDRLRLDLDTLGFAVDLLMIGLIIINLSLIIFDWLFAVPLVEQALSAAVPRFSEAYRTHVHEDFLSWDLMFVSVYLTEFSIRWIIAIVRHSHDKWFFYPFIHWYDLLGCIPVGSFRWLRVLRVISLLYRLQKRGVVDLRDTWLGATLLRYYEIIIEELSDRIVINVLSGVQREVKGGNPLVKRIENQVLAPRKPALVDYLAERIVAAIRHTHGHWRADLGTYLGHLSEEALTRTEEGRRLAAMPVAGPRAVALVRDAVRKGGLALADQFVEDLADPHNRHHLDQLLDSLISELAGDRTTLNQLTRDTLLDILEQVKIQVGVQQWKLTGGEPGSDNQVK
ncbi:MAG: ion transporter [Alcanivoracaceae bacterium]